MDYRSAYIRRNRQGSRLKKRLAAAGLLGLAACAGLFALAMHEPTALTPSTQALAPAGSAALAPAVLRTAAQVEAQEKTRKTRRVYPYSIVPGGLADRRELARAVVMDKVVAVHYAAFETDKATVRTVDKPRAVYVSYRKGDRVFWTSKKLQLAQGETLLSDGQNEIRTRCGNRISDVPQLPVEAQGPSEEELDTSVEMAEDDAGEGTVAQVGFAVDTNPAGHGYQLQSFGSGAATAQNTNASRTRGSAGMTPTYTSGLVPIRDGGTLAVAGKASADSAGAGGSGKGTTGTGTSGGGTSGTGTPSTGTSSTGTSSTGTSATGTPGTGAPAAGAPATQAPATQTPATEKPTANTPAATTPGKGTTTPATSGTSPSKPGKPNAGGPKTGAPTTGTPTTGTPTTGDTKPGDPHTPAPVTQGADTGNAGDVKKPATGTSDTPAGGKTGTTEGTTKGTSGGTTPDSAPSTGGTQPTAMPDGPLLPPTGPDTTPPPIPGTLLPPTTDVPVRTNDPAKPPVKPPVKPHANVPEPGTPWLAGAGVAALLAARRARKRTRK